MSSTPTESARELRRRAEEKLASGRATNLETPTPVDPQRLLHEMQVYQIELEMQNEELRYAIAERDEKDALLGTYQDLYELAPAGYFNIDHDGIINAVNLTGAIFLGVERSMLINNRLDAFISKETRPAFHGFLEKVFASDDKESCEVVFVKKNHSPLFVQIEAIAAKTRNDCRAVIIDITARKQAEETVNESETKYRNLFENMTEEVYFWKLVRDEEGRIKTWKLVDANPPTLKTWGRTTLDEIKGKTPDEIFGLGATDHYMTVVQKIMTEGKSHVFEDYFPPLDKYFRFTSVPLGDSFITTGADVTDIKKAKLALRESEERLRLLTDNLPESAVYQYVHEHDGNPRFIYVSAGIEQLNGVTPEEVLQDAGALLRQIPPEFFEQYIEAGVRSKRDLSDFDMELPIHRPDGEMRWMRLHSRPRRISDGSTVWDGVQIDITERKQAEEALRLSEERFRGLFEQTPEGIFVADAHGRYLDVNPAGAQMLGYTQEEICRMSVADVVAPEEIARIPERVSRHAVGTLDRNEWRFKRKDGTFFIGEVVGCQLPDGRLQGILLDVTAHKQVEAMLKDMNKELEMRVAERTHELGKIIEMLKVETAERIQAVEDVRDKERMLIQQSRQAAMGEMIGNIAHQWRQPLNVLGMQIQGLKIFYDLGEFNKELLEKNVAESMEIIQHMSKTIDDFRNYFKPDKEKTEFNVRESIETSLSLLEGCLKNPLIDVEVIADDDPAIYGFPNEFAQVFLNIMNNTKDVFIERAISNPKVTIKIGTEDGCAVVTVADNAGGIPEDIINKVFDPYFTTKGPQHGTGIGLFMSKAIIEKNMGGRLTVRNVAHGAEFRIEMGNGSHTLH